MTVDCDLDDLDYVSIISNFLNLRKSQVKNVLNLIEDCATVPFIARYRKEVTGNLCETQIRSIIEKKEKEENLFKLKKTAMNQIYEQGKLTQELKDSIILCSSISQVEDIYSIYRRKKKTKAQIAIEKGFEIVALMIKEQKKIEIPYLLLQKYSADEIIEGANDIVIAEIADDVKNREYVRSYFLKHGEIESKLKENRNGFSENILRQIPKFEIYYSFLKHVLTIKAYQILALNRADKLGILNVKLKKDIIALEGLNEKYQVVTDELRYCVKEGFNRIFSSIETEIRNMLTEKAEIESIRTFQMNLKNLLMVKPEYGKVVLGVDPGFRTGCKLAIIDKQMNPLEFSKVYIEKKQEFLDEIKRLKEKYRFDVIALGNGTGSLQANEILKDYVVEMVNEDGASVYSASDVANEEFENLDATDRGTISIARRYVDPLSELVKVPVGSIGVGMYQHDMNQKELEKKLSYVVEDVVNSVGINVNTSGIHILKFISGLDLRTAKKIVANKPYKNRECLKKILSDKAYQQSVGFLRVFDSNEKLDNTNIHPEQYKLARYVIENNIKNFSLDLKEYYNDCNQVTIDDIWKAYENIGYDIRQNTAKLSVNNNISIEDIKVDSVYDGIVRNVMQFGAFVDIGVKQNGLVHISMISDGFIKDPLSVVKVGDKVRVKVLSVDIKLSKIQLSMRDL